MIQKTISIEYQEVKITELDSNDEKLLEQAKLACRNAYAPYSHFHVGASLLLENGKIITGNNQENSAYPSGLCAERVALFSASAQYPGVAADTIVIVAETNDFILPQPVTPCGACRQVMVEYEKYGGKQMRILLANDEKVWILNGVSSLLPLMFHGENLRK